VNLQRKGNTMDKNLKMLMEHIELNKQSIINEAVLYECRLILEAMKGTNLDSLLQASQALTKAVAPVKSKIPLLAAVAKSVGDLAAEVESEEDERRAAQIVGHATELMFQLDSALNYISVKLIDLFKEKLYADTKDLVPLSTLMSPKQVQAIADKISKEFFRKESSSFLSKVPFMKGSMSKKGFTPSQAASISQSILNLNFSQLETFIYEAGLAGTMVNSIKNKTTDIESVSKSHLGAAWDFVKNFGAGGKSFGVGGIRGENVEFETD